MLYTTYFSAAKKLPPEVAPVSISLYPPAGWHGFDYKKLAPDAHDFSVYKATGDVERFARAYYIHTLSNLSRREVIDDLKALTGAPDIALVCFEGADKFCHRRIAAAWLEDGGFLCPEYNFAKESK